MRREAQPKKMKPAKIHHDTTQRPRRPPHAHGIRKVQHRFGSHMPILKRKKPHFSTVGGVRFPAGGRVQLPAHAEQRHAARACCGVATELRVLRAAYPLHFESYGFVSERLRHHHMQRVLHKMALAEQAHAHFHGDHPRQCARRRPALQTRRR